jgi:hypothetical protein
LPTARARPPTRSWQSCPDRGLVAAGFEHSVANMFFIPIGLFVKSDTASRPSMRRPESST